MYTCISPVRNVKYFHHFPYILYTVQFQFTSHSLNLSDNVLCESACRNSNCYLLKLKYFQNLYESHWRFEKQLHVDCEVSYMRKSSLIIIGHHHKAIIGIGFPPYISLLHSTCMCMCMCSALRVCIELFPWQYSWGRESIILTLVRRVRSFCWSVNCIGTCTCSLSAHLVLHHTINWPNLLEWPNFINYNCNAYVTQAYIDTCSWNP